MKMLWFNKNTHLSDTSVTGQGAKRHATGLCKIVQEFQRLFFFTVITGK